MKFFIFTCLVAAALAKHAVKDKPSSEESASVYLGKYKQGNGVFFQTPQDSASSSSSEESSEEISEKIEQSEEQKVNLNQQKKSKQFSQDSSFPQICTPYQQQSSVNQWPQPNAIYNIPSQESTSTSVEEILKKIIDIVKYFQYQQLTNPHFPQAVHPQIPVSSWAPSKDYTFPTARYMA
ncbi:casein gamma [Rattus norvegicus]|uniref:Casein gamma n=1 Tax=Rattus norvegicus TaxID=10116 RepID=A6KU19_RAT|nr:alpha-S2-casein-like A precursor [Rattus norvegicus]EDL83147.1 casein gamma [Rattus norvegicus]|eukprot:NP_001099211.1 alpha-S2-casein-like A precursor [Rattus norvegicus]